MTDLSKQLGLKTGYVSRILSLNSLAPDIVEAILAGIEPDGLSIAKLTEQPIPDEWNEQWRLYGFPQRRFTYSQKMEKFPFFGNIMQESFIAPDLDHWLIYQPILRRFSET